MGSTVGLFLRKQTAVDLSQIGHQWQMDETTSPVSSLGIKSLLQSLWGVLTGARGIARQLDHQEAHSSMGDGSQKLCSWSPLYNLQAVPSSISPAVAFAYAPAPWKPESCNFSELPLALSSVSMGFLSLLLTAVFQLGKHSNLREGRERNFLLRKQWNGSLNLPIWLLLRLESPWGEPVLCSTEMPSQDLLLHSQQEDRAPPFPTYLPLLRAAAGAWGSWSYCPGCREGWGGSTHFPLCIGPKPMGWCNPHSG